MQAMYNVLLCSLLYNEHEKFSINVLHELGQRETVHCIFLFVLLRFYHVCHL